MTTEKQVAIVASHSLIAFTAEILEKAKQGWDFDFEMLPVQGIHMYECAMVRYPTKEELQRDADALGKPSRADILAKARAAKAEKATTNV